MTPKMAGMGLQCLGNSQIKISIRNKGVKIGLEIFSFLIVGKILRTLNGKNNYNGGAPSIQLLIEKVKAVF